MAAMQIGNVSAGELDGRLRITQEDVERFLAGSGAGYATPDAKPRIQAYRIDLKGAMGLSVVQTMPWKRMRALRSDPNAPPSDEAGTGNAYGSRPMITIAAAGSSVEVGTGNAYGRFRPPEPRWLEDALAELKEVDDEIAEDGLPQVSDSTKAEAERLVRDLAWTPLAPSVYPTQDAEIALHFKSPGVSGTVVILLSDGGRADCHAYVGGSSRRAHYQTSSDLPDAFVLDQLHRLTPARAAVSGAAARVRPIPPAFQANLLSTW